MYLFRLGIICAETYRLHQSQRQLMYVLYFALGLCVLRITRVLGTTTYTGHLNFRNQVHSTPKSTWQPDTINLLISTVSQP